MILAIACISSFIVGGITTFLGASYLADKEATQMENEHPTAASFFDYIAEYPELRFWQALSNWSGNHILVYPLCYPVIDVTNRIRDLKDTWEWKGRDK